MAQVMYEVKVDDIDAKKKIASIIKVFEKLSAVLEKNSNIQINVSVVQVEKKWYQFWK